LSPFLYTAAMLADFREQGTVVYL